MAPIEALKWIFEKFDMYIEPYVAVTDYSKQTREYWCCGCEGKFISSYPEWEEPTDEAFPHEDGCRYIAAKSLAA